LYSLQILGSNFCGEKKIEEPISVISNFEAMQMKVLPPISGEAGRVLLSTVFIAVF
jgi:hypothetical protein